MHDAARAKAARLVVAPLVLLLPPFLYSVLASIIFFLAWPPLCLFLIGLHHDFFWIGLHHDFSGLASIMTFGGKAKFGIFLTREGGV